MSRKGENIRKRKDGRWEARYIKGRNADGRALYASVYANGYLAVRRKREELLRGQAITEDGEIHKKTEEEFGILCGIWKEQKAKCVRESTYANYCCILENHIIKEFGGSKVGELTEEMIQNYMSKDSFRTLSNARQHSIAALFKGILQFGYEEGYLSFNPEKIQVPRVDKTAKKILCEAEWKKLSDYLWGRGDEMSMGILIGMYTGLRVGELCGLQWKHVDFERGYLLIRCTVSRIQNYREGEERQTSVAITRPKTASSVRDIPLPKTLLNYLRERRRLPEDFLLTGKTSPTEPRNVQRYFDTVQKKLDIPHVSFHALRHSFASRCNQLGFDTKILSEILGHSSVRTTMDIYVHSSEIRKQSCMEQFLGDEKDTSVVC